MIKKRIKNLIKLYQFLFFRKYIKEITGLQRIEPKHYYLLESIEYLRNLDSIPNSYFSSKDDKILLFVEGVIIFIENLEDLFIANEVFFEGEYNFDLPYKCIVIDVGMHVGMASLFFASKRKVMKVYSFEPFIPTFNQAIRNIALNKQISSKIIAMPFGVGEKDDNISAEYSYNWKGSVGLMGLTPEMIENSKDIRQETGEIREICGQINEIISDNPETPLVLKLDCEGSEYQILDKIFYEGVDSKIHLFLIEWHEGLSNDILKYFKDRNFVCYSKGVHNENNGFLFAYNALKAKI